MKVLFAGNSQAVCIMQAYIAEPELMEKFDVSFCMVPGGTGPYLTIVNSKLHVVMEVPKFPPRFHPETAKEACIDCYDAIVVGGLGYYDGGFHYPNSVLPFCLLHQFAPRANEYTAILSSKALCKEIVFKYMSKQLGIAFLRALRASFTGKILVHPFPVLSETVKTHPNWPLNKMYKDPLGAHAFFMRLRDDFLEQECRANEAVLLPYPRPDWREALFAPTDAMGGYGDGIHPSDSYGVMILHQVAEFLTATS